MRALIRILALGLAGAVLLAAATPCPPNPEAYLTSATGESAPLEMRAKCPCSCSEGEAPRLASTHLDFAVERADADAPLARTEAAVATTQPALPAPPFAPLETVPI